MTIKQGFEQIRKLAGWAVSGPELEVRLKQIETIIKDLREENQSPKKTRQKKGGLDRQETGGEDR